MEKMLPKTARELTNGGVYRQQVRCGKRTCRCVKPGENHVAYYFISRTGGKQHKRYLRKDEVESMVQLVAESRKLRTAKRRLLDEDKMKLHRFKSFLQNLDAD